LLAAVAAVLTAAAGFGSAVELGPDAEAISLLSEKEDATVVQSYAKQGFGEYRADGRDDLALSAMRTLDHRGAAPADGLLGEDDSALLQVFSQAKQHQPIKSKEKFDNKDMCLSSENKDNCNNKLRTDCDAVLVECTKQPVNWFYNHFTKRLEAEEGKTDQKQPVEKCLTRKDGGSKIVVSDCSEEASQVWEWQCEAFTFLDEESKKTKVLAWQKEDVDGQERSKVIVEVYFGEPINLWDYTEVIRHSRCRTKRYKVFKFRGTLATTVVQKSFIGWPTTGVTVQFWMKGQSGVPVSYASEGVPEPPYMTQLAVNLKQGKITLELFDVEFPTDVEVPKFKWFNVAVSWDKKFGNLKLHIDGKEKWKKATQEAKPKEGKPQFGESEFLAGGCLMMGHKAKKPCKSRIASTGFVGEMADLLVHRGVLTSEAITDAMFAPVDASYVASIMSDAPVNPPETGKLLIAYLTRQYGSQEYDTVWPPECILKPEERASMNEVSADGHAWGKLCSMKSGSTYKEKNPVTGATLNDNDCKMYWNGVGDVHYKSFGGCKYDDQSAGEWVLAMMKPQYYKLHPLTAQFMSAPTRGGGSWSMFQTVIINGVSYTLPAMLSYVDGCAMKFKEERVAAGFGGYYYIANTGKGNEERSRYTAYGEFQKGETKTRMGSGGWSYLRASCSGVSRCTTSEHFHGQMYIPSRLTMEMTDGFRIDCYKGGSNLYAPRILAGKIYGLAGNQHYKDMFNGGGYTGPSSNKPGNVATTEWDTGINNKNIAFLNNLAATTWKGKLVSGNKGNADQVTSDDLKPMVPGKPNMGLVNPRDGLSYNCRTSYSYGSVQSAYNGNRPWKGIAKAFVSWRVDDDEIATIFGTVSENRKNGRTRWHELTPAFGVASKSPNGARAAAEKGCASLINFKKAYVSCIFDFMATGKDGTKKNIAGKKSDRASKPKMAKSYSVRDASGNNGMGRWVNRPSWGCVDEFAAQLTAAAKRHYEAKHRAAKHNSLCGCKHNYLGVCAYDHFMCIADINLKGNQMNFANKTA